MLRVTGQVLVAFFQVAFLPPMPAWYSGLMPYPFLLPSQIFLIAVMATVCVDFTRRRGYFYAPRRAFATALLWFGWVYLAAMVARLFWFGLSIPVVFHWVLAAFVLTVAYSHRRRLDR